MECESDKARKREREKGTTILAQAASGSRTLGAALPPLSFLSLLTGAQLSPTRALASSAPPSLLSSPLQKGVLGKCALIIVIALQRDLGVQRTCSVSLVP